MRRCREIPASSATWLMGRPSWMIRSIIRRRPSGVNGAFWWGNRYSVDLLLRV